MHDVKSYTQPNLRKPCNHAQRCAQTVTGRIKDHFWVQSSDQDKISLKKILIPVANGSTVVMSVTTP